MRQHTWKDELVLVDWSREPISHRVVRGTMDLNTFLGLHPCCLPWEIEKKISKSILQNFTHQYFILVFLDTKWMQHSLTFWHTPNEKGPTKYSMLLLAQVDLPCAFIPLWSLNISVFCIHMKSPQKLMWRSKAFNRKAGKVLKQEECRVRAHGSSAIL